MGLDGLSLIVVRPPRDDLVAMFVVERVSSLHCVAGETGWGCAVGPCLVSAACD